MNNKSQLYALAVRRILVLGEGAFGDRPNWKQFRGVLSKELHQLRRDICGPSNTTDSYVSLDDDGDDLESALDEDSGYDF